MSKHIGDIYQEILVKWMQPKETPIVDLVGWASVGTAEPANSVHLKSLQKISKPECAIQFTALALCLQMSSKLVLCK